MVCMVQVKREEEEGRGESEGGERMMVGKGWKERGSMTKKKQTN